MEEAAPRGVTITKKTHLTFDHIIKMAISIANRQLNLLRLLRSTNWGCKSNIIMQLYKQFVRAALEYGAIALLSARKTTRERIHSESCKLQKYLHNAIKNREKKEDESLENYKKQYGNENGT